MKTRTEKVAYPAKDRGKEGSIDRDQRAAWTQIDTISFRPIFPFPLGGFSLQNSEKSVVNRAYQAELALNFRYHSQPQPTEAAVLVSSWSERLDLQLSLALSQHCLLDGFDRERDKENRPACRSIALPNVS